LAKFRGWDKVPKGSILSFADNRIPFQYNVELAENTLCTEL